jgi:uncharacterized protein (TIGR03382 family)
MSLLKVVPLLLAAALPRAADAHGIWGHVHVTGWAVENMPDDDLRAFLLEPEVFNALLFGAVFTDTGYARDSEASRAYSEHTHWEPFIEDYVQLIVDNDPPPWDSLESRKRVAFLLGCASHGLQDSIFDSLFLYQVDEHDGLGQEEADPGTDGFLVLDGHIRFVPEKDIPMETVLELYEVLDVGVTQEVIDDAVDLTVAAYVNDSLGLAIAANMGETYGPDMPWTRAHYLDTEIPGSLRAEILPTLRYQQAIWDRLHQQLDPQDVTLGSYPDVPRRLLSPDATTPDSWVSLMFGAGVAYADGIVELTDAQGAAVPFTQANTRWGADYTRIVRLQPTEDLEPGAWYTAQLASGALLIDGQQTTAPYSVTFQVACATPDDPACPEVEVIEPSIDGIPANDTADTALVDPTDKGGCGCGSSPTAPVGLALVTALAPLLRRRRR